MNYLACTRQYKCNDCNNSFKFTWNAAVNPVPENVTCPKCNSKNVVSQTLFTL
jgi:DNA-directed RNA polymerase subunit RPC12/RpoP